MPINVKERLQMITNLKKDVLEEVVNSDLSTVEKIKEICEHGLLPVSPFINHEFKEWEKELEEKVKSLYPRKEFAITDSFLSPSEMDLERYQTVKYDYVLETIENYEDDDQPEEDHVQDPDFEEDWLNQKMTVVTARGVKEKIVKTKKEVVDKLYEFMLKNQVCGFEVDW